MFLTLKIFWRMFFSVSMIQWTKKWRVHAPVCQEIILLWYRPHIDVFATILELETYVSLIPEGKAWVVDHMTLSWQDIFSCMFPSFRLLPNILHEIQSDLCKAIIIAPAWQRQSRFKQLLFFCCAMPRWVPSFDDLLSRFKGEKIIRVYRISIGTLVCCHEFTQKRRLLWRSNQAYHRVNLAIYRNRLWLQMVNFLCSVSVKTIWFFLSYCPKYCFLFEEKGYTTI